MITTVHHAYDGRIYHKQCKSLNKAGHEVILIAPKPETIKNEGIQVIPIDKPESECKRFIFSLKVIKPAVRVKADIYHFHDPELIPAGFFIRILTRKPVIFDVHEHYPRAIMSKVYLNKFLKVPVKLLYEIIERISLPFLSGIIYTTEEIGKRYNKYASCKLENFPPKNLFKCDENLIKDDSLLLYLGGITEIRGIRQLVEAFSIVEKDYPDIKLLFVGAFESKQFEKEIMKKVEELGLRKKIVFKGKVPYEEVRHYLEKASIGILPYLPVPNHLVCLPNKLFEYMASGVAVVASDFSNYRRVIKNCQCGVLVNPESPESIAEGILYLLKNKNITQKMQMNGLKMFESTYNWEEEEKKLIDFYESLLKGKNRI